MWGDSEKPDSLLLGSRLADGGASGSGRHLHHHHHFHHPHQHFGIGTKPFYHMNRIAGGASSSTSASSSSTHPTMPLHIGIPSSSSLQHHQRPRTPQSLVMWKGETSRKKRFARLDVCTFRNVANQIEFS
ncbi:unnamed protein product [Caenorhabditis bovis]|uniref:Uncharacterized protein n=1 Tax=Caenorhabditis bovis TaxID=2654633 RepID=A0A8S1F0E1_9PELO|nr:unnamed protein product [Caenorhabditis bovis]